ncbi:outer dense fiber protein 3-like protein 1 [Platysternon megacephalum]|uniref:Outer dense fiber protein 3-like protein 1 n=1 Tax=Platysternon megacephalum TaxID=55544 RepID=A0A4D9E8W6_9SAUR|nr:outer dense fiber protein 3-like protein 1 [Platysternon megacephalum]
MLLLGSLKAMKRKQLFWTMFYVLSLMDNKVSGENNHSSSATTSPSAMNATITSVTPAMTTVTLTETKVSLEPKNISTTPEGKASTTEMTKVTEDTSPATSAGPTQTHTDVSDQSVSVKTSPDSQPNTSHAPFSTTAQTMTSEMVSTATTTVLTEQTSHSATTGPPPSSTVKPYYTFTCQNIKHVKKPRVICLHLSEPDTCTNFLKTKGANLSMVICDTTNRFSSPLCHIELAKSEVDPSCMLLIQAGVKDADAIEKLLQDQKFDLTKIGIKSHKLESIGRHQNIPRNTLIALVTSGLLLAFLSLAGYFLMKRRSWSPRGERLDEDHSYTENGSQGNTGITVASQEQSEPQEKPNLNRGAHKNGTGQASSKNGHSTRQHIVADTEL